MHYIGTVYRPPVEAKTVLFQVTVGCSHDSCTFCGMYKDVDFRIVPIEQIEEDFTSYSKKSPTS